MKNIWRAGAFVVFCASLCGTAYAACPESMPERTLTGQLTYFSDDEYTMGTDYSIETSDGKDWLLFPVGPYFGNSDEEEMGYTRGARFDAILSQFVDKTVRVTACAGEGLGGPVLDKIRSIDAV